MELHLAKLFSNYNTNNAIKLFAALSSALLSAFHLLSNPNNLLQKGVRQGHLAAVV